MRIISIKESYRKGQIYYQISTDEGEFFCTDEDYIIHSVYDWMDDVPCQKNLKELLYQINDNYEFTTARLAVVKFVSTKIICRKDLVEKLRKLSLKNDIIERVCDWYIENGYIDDYTYAEKYVINTMNLKPCSKNKIRLELQMKGIETKAIDKAMDLIDSSELELCNRLFLARYDFEEMKDEKIKNRAVRYLAGKGFRMGDILKAIKGKVESE